MITKLTKDYWFNVVMAWAEARAATLPGPQQDELIETLDALKTERTQRDQPPPVDQLLNLAKTFGARRVHAAWRDIMLHQERGVAVERLTWDTLSDQDKALDAGIAFALYYTLYYPTVADEDKLYQMLAAHLDTPPQGGAHGQ